MSMAPSAPTIALTLAVGFSGRSVHSFELHGSFRSRWAWGVCSPPSSLAPPSRRRPRPASTLLAAAQPQEDAGNGADSNDNKIFQYVLGQTATDTEGVGADAEAEALRQQVLANEKGFRESSAFNPVRARQAQEEEETRVLAAQWGSTPERAKEIMKTTQADKDMSFQELERIAEGLNMTDEQQRAFMLKASMKKLSSSTTLPKRAPRDRVKEAVNDRVFASEKGFLQNSAAFKSRMKVGSGVRFDSGGFPAMNEDDPVIQAAKKRTKEETKSEGVTFPSLPDCPRCSTPTYEDELAQFGMCAQCKAQEISAKSYKGPQAPSKYTYDNGDAPFSASWMSPVPAATKGNDSTGARRKATRTKSGEAPPPPVASSSAAASSPSASSSRKRRTREPPPPAPVDDPGGVAMHPPPASFSIGDDGRGEPTAEAGMLLQNGESRSGNRRSSGKGSARLGQSSAPALVPEAAGASSTPPPTKATANTAVETAAASTRSDRAGGKLSGKAAAAPTVGRAPTPGKESSTMGGKTLSNATIGSRNRSDFARVPASTVGRGSASDSADATPVPTSAERGRAHPGWTKTKLEARVAAAEQARGSGGGGEGGGGGGSDDDVSGRTRSAERAEVAMRKLSLEVSELRTQLTINRAALARVETLSGRAAAGKVYGAGGGESRNSGESDAWRDDAIRKLTRDVAELRKELSGVLDNVGDAAVTAPRGRGGDTELVQNLKLEVVELRSQLESARKETALTRSALRRLQDDIDGLKKAVVRR